MLNRENSSQTRDKPHGRTIRYRRGSKPGQTDRQARNCCLQTPHDSDSANDFLDFQAPEQSAKDIVEKPEHVQGVLATANSVILSLCGSLGVTRAGNLPSSSP